MPETLRPAEVGELSNSGEGTSQAAPVLDWDPYSDEVLEDPYPFFAALRAVGPVAWLPQHGIYAVGQYDAVKSVLTDHARFSTSAGVGLQDSRDPHSGARVRNALLEVDPPEHTAIRTVLQRILSPALLRSLRDNFLVEARAVVSEVLEAGKFDGMTDLAEAFIYRVFPKAVGIRFDRQAIKAIGQLSFNQSGPDNARTRKAVAEAAAYIDWFFESARKENVVPGSVAHRIFEAEEAGELAPGVAESMVRVFVRGGTDSTISGIGHTIHLLASRPEYWQALRADPSIARTILDAGLRIESPFHVTCRITTGDFVFEGIRLEAERKVAVFLGAANHDPEQWDRPGVFDPVERVAGRQMSFGGGAHICIGQSLARLEAECLLIAMAEKIGTLELAGIPTQHLMNQMRVLGKLPLHATPAP